VLILLSFGVIAAFRLPAVAAACCLVAGLGFYMLHNTLQVNATQMAPSQRGSGVALFAACLFLGQSCGVSLAGYASERLGTAPVILFGGVAVLVLAASFAFARRRLALHARATVG
jgi:predicted MFS family arabinose efflux permease